MHAVDISLSGLDVEWRRLEIIAQNLANMNTTRTELGETYQPLTLVSGPVLNFEALLESGGDLSTAPTGVRVMSVEPQDSEPRMVLDPEHPHADLDGFVSYPDIDHAQEMVNMIKTSRVYEANLTAVSLAHQMYTRALELGGR